MIWHRPFSPGERGFLIVGLMRTADALVVAASALFAFWLRNDLADLPAHYTLAILIAIIALANGLQVAGVYNFRTVAQLHGQFGRIVLVWIAVTVALIVIAYFTKTSGSFSRVWAATWFTTACAGLLINRLIAVGKVEIWRAEGKLTRRLAVVGDGTRAGRLREHLAASGPHDVEIVGVFVPDPVAADGLPALAEAVRAGTVDEIVIALDGDAGTDTLTRLVRALGTLPVEVRFAPDMTELPFPVLGTSYLGTLPLLDLHHRPLSVWSRVVKRAEDLLLGMLFLTLSAPLMGMIALAIRVTSKGPVLFRQPRLGFNNNAFTLYKFRTMHADASVRDGAPDAEPAQARRGDPRVTAVGGFLRRTSLDELPQLFNVIRGEMSLVGPRPHALAHNRDYAIVVDGYLGRHRVKPGLTGWAQVCGFRGETDTLEKMRARVEHDLYYIEHWSLWFDLRILMMTFVFGFFHRNAY